MLRRENELRLSSETLTRFQREGHESYVPITEEIQLQVCQEFNLPEEIGLTALQCANVLMPTEQDRKEIQEISFYRKYNRMRDGEVSEGDRIPEICHQFPFYTLNSDLISFCEILQLHKIERNHKRMINIVFASSIS